MVVSGEDGEIAWWTFAGTKANASLAPALAEVLRRQATYDGLSIQIAPGSTLDVAGRAIKTLRRRGAASFVPVVDEAAAEGLKFSDCLPEGLAAQVLRLRSLDPGGVAALLAEPVRLVRGAGT